MNKTLNEQAALVRERNTKWWTDLQTGQPITRNKGELLMLVITELSEATDGIRRNMMDDKLPHRSMEEVEMADAKIRLLDFAGGFGIELYEVNGFGESHPDLVFGENKAENMLKICALVVEIYVNEYGYSQSISGTIAIIEAYCKKFGLDLDGAMAEKMDYNLTRADHQREARLAANGKKF